MLAPIKTILPDSCFPIEITMKALLLLTFAIFSVIPAAPPGFSYVRPLPAGCEGDRPLAENPWDEIVLIDVRELKGYLSFPGSKLSPIVKAKVRLATWANRSLTPERPYEELWFSDTLAVGCVRQREFDIPRNPHKHMVVIKVRAKQGSPLSATEARASASAIVRLYLDACLNGNYVVFSSVPASALGDIVSALTARYFSLTSNKGMAPEMTPVLRLVTDDGKDEQTLYFKSKS